MKQRNRAVQACLWQWLVRLGLIVMLICLTGCVRYDVGVNFQGQYRGTIVQHIELGKQLTSFSQSEAENWLNSFERRAQQLQGKTQRLSPQEIIVTIPFSNGEELARKFNQFFNRGRRSLAAEGRRLSSSRLEKPGGGATSPGFSSRGTSHPTMASQPVELTDLDVLQLKCALSVRQSNWLLLERNRLSLSVDLRALGVLSDRGNLIVGPGSLIDLDFSLRAPWGVRNVMGAVAPETSTAGKQVVWKLQPGQINQIEAVFWLPNPLGVGALLIVGLVIGGFYLKYRHFPGMAPA